jgi:hypothetical protein
MQQTSPPQKHLHYIADFGKTRLVHRLPGQENHIPTDWKACEKRVNTGPQPAFRPVALHGHSDRAARHHPNPHLL